MFKRRKAYSPNLTGGRNLCLSVIFKFLIAMFTSKLKSRSPLLMLKKREAYGERIIQSNVNGTTVHLPKGYFKFFKLKYPLQTFEIFKQFSYEQISFVDV